MGGPAASPAVLCCGWAADTECDTVCDAVCDGDAGAKLVPSPPAPCCVGLTVSLWGQ